MRVIHIHWPRLLRRSLRILFGLITLLVAAWFCMGWYIRSHKAEILAKVTADLSEQVQGELLIRDMEPFVWTHFPNVSVSLKDVSLRDSLWSTHKHSLFEAKDMYIQVNPFALLSHRTEITKITAAHGTVFLYVDSLGNSNTYLLSRRDTTKKNRPALVTKFGMEDMHLWYVNETKYKLFHLYIKTLDGRSERSDGLTTVHLESDAHVHEFNFSTIRGSYIHEQDLTMDIHLRYHIREKQLDIPDQRIRIGGTPIYLGGNFYFNRSPAAFSLYLHSPSLAYPTALAWMSPNIQKVLKNYAFTKPIAIKILVSGVMQYKAIPLVTLNYTVKNNQLTTPLGNIDNISYAGVYYNEAARGYGHGDNNSMVGLYGLSGSWRGIPFTGDTITATNLLRPYIHAHVKSHFPISQINDIVGGNSFSFDRGTASADLRYDGGILPSDPTPYGINGYVQIRDGALSYLPRNLAFTNVGATVLFGGDNLYFRNITLNSRHSSVIMDGEALHFLRLYFTDPGKVSLSWKVRSPMINLNDFISFVGKRKAPTRQSKASGSIARIGNQLDRVLELGNFALDARVDKMVYKNFNASGVIARLTVAQSGIGLQQVAIQHGGGSLLITGVVNQLAPNNPFALKAVVRNADVANLFHGFDNFGQKAIASNNLRGRVSADVNVRGNVTESGQIIRNSINGTVSFTLLDGQINHFPPFEKVGRFVFKKRNLSEVSVRDLHGQFDVAGSKVFIRPMEIQTSVVNMNVQGVYGLQGGTDIYLEVPLRNPEKEEAHTPFGKLLRKGKGIVLHLRAQDPTGDGVKIGWDPLRKGEKSTEALLD